MGDLCVRYTVLVDRYLPNMAASLLQARDLVVARHALLLLTELLQQDFLKWRGDLLYRFLLGALADDDDAMRMETEFALGEVFLRRNPSLFLQSFVDTVYVLTGCTAHPKFNAFARHDLEAKKKKAKSSRGDQGDDDDANGDDAMVGGGAAAAAGAGATGDHRVEMGVASVVGAPSLDMAGVEGTRGHAARLQIYRSMLRRMPDEHKFQVMAQLCHDVLGAVVEGIIPAESTTLAKQRIGGSGSGNASLSSPAPAAAAAAATKMVVTPEYQLLRDTFEVLCSADIKIGFHSAAEPSAEAAELMAAASAAGGGGAAAAGSSSPSSSVRSAFATAKGRLLTKMSKKLVIKDTLPMLIRLKKQLEEMHSPRLKHLMAYLKVGG